MAVAGSAASLGEQAALTPADFEAPLQPGPENHLKGVHDSSKTAAIHGVGGVGGVDSKGQHEGNGKGGIGSLGDDSKGGRSLSKLRSQSGEHEDDGNVVHPNDLDTVEKLRVELGRVNMLLHDDRERSRRTEEAGARVRARLVELQNVLAAVEGGSSDALVGVLKRRAEVAEAELEDTRRKLLQLEEYTNTMDEKFNQIQVKLAEAGGMRMSSPVQEETGSSRREGHRGIDGNSRRVLQMIDDKNQLISNLRRRVGELEGAGGKIKGSRSGHDAEGYEEECTEIPYDVLDRLDDELAQAREMLLLKDSELEAAKISETAIRTELQGALEWKERAVQAQKAGSVTNIEVAKLERELVDERGMRRVLEVRFDEKLKLKVRELDVLSSEMARLKRNGEQLGPVLAELERTKVEVKGWQEQSKKEMRKLQSSLAMCESDRQKAEGRLAFLTAEMTQFEAKIKNSEEVRWRSGLNLAKVKAEMDWRMKADQEKDFFLERMKDELDRLKSKLMRAEMRKLKMEESLEEAVLELRSKRRELQHMKHKVEGIMRVVQQQAVSYRGSVPNMDAERGRMHAETYQ